MSLDYSKYEPEENATVSNWLLSFADLIGLLLAFFILIFTFAEPQSQKFAEIRRAFSPTEPINQAELQPLNDYTPEKAAINYLEKLIKQNIPQNISELSVTTNARSIVISFHKSVLQGNDEFYKNLTQTLTNLSNQIEVVSSSPDLAIRKQQTKLLSERLGTSGYASEIFEFYSLAFQNISNADDKKTNNENSVAVIIRPYEAFK